MTGFRLSTQWDGIFYWWKGPTQKSFPGLALACADSAKRALLQKYILGLLSDSAGERTTTKTILWGSCLHFLSDSAGERTTTKTILVRESALKINSGALPDSA